MGYGMLCCWFAVEIVDIQVCQKSTLRFEKRLEIWRRKLSYLWSQTDDVTYSLQP